MKKNDTLTSEDGIGTRAAAFRGPDGGSTFDEPMTLPPNTSLAKFKDYMQRAADIVGTENTTVISSNRDLQHDHYLYPSKAHDVSLTLALDVATPMPTEAFGRCTM